MKTHTQAWRIRAYGGPDVLQAETRTIGGPSEGELLVNVRASAVTRADTMMRAGLPTFARLFLGLSRPRAPFAGTCFAGDVVAIGTGVTQFHVGDAVFGEAGLNFGANAQYLTVAAGGSVLAKPQDVTYEEAATLCDGALTSWHFLTRVAQVGPGNRVLVLGGAGSLGSAALQAAVACGAQVDATSGARNRALLRDLGAEQAIDYTRTDPFQRGTTYDVVFDTVGAARFAEAKSALRPRGQYLCPVLGLRLLRDMVLSKVMRSQRARFAAAGMASPDLHRTELTELLQLMAENRFRPIMDRTYPLADLIEAHRYVEAGHKRGNVVVV